MVFYFGRLIVEIVLWIRHQIGENGLLLRDEGLFGGFIEKNCLTFNPGWDQNAQNVDSFDDVRDIQARLKAAGVSLLTECDPETQGPASITLEDPDGNAILIDQHR